MEWIKHTGEVNTQLSQEKARLYQENAAFVEHLLESMKHDLDIRSARRLQYETELDLRKRELDLEKAEKTLQKEKTQLLEQHKLVKKLEKTRETARSKD